MRIKGILLCLFLLVGCSTSTQATENKEFKNFMDEEYKYLVTSSYVDYHSYIENGTDTISVSLEPHITEENLKKQAKRNKEKLEEIQTFDYKTLSQSQKDTYDMYVFTHTLESSMNQSKYNYYEQYLCSGNGIHTQIPILLSDWIFRNEQDILDFITLLKDIPSYMDDLITYLKLQLNNDTLILDKDEINSYCDTVLKTSTRQSILNSIFDSIETLSLKKDYHKEIEDTFNKTFVKSYQTLQSTIQSFSEKKCHLNYSELKNGKEYYELLIQSKTGLKDSIKDIQDKMEGAMATHYINAIQLLQSHPSYYEKIDDLKTDYTSFDEIISSLVSHASSDFPDLKMIDYEVKDLNTQLIGTTTVAYYTIPPIDHSSKDMIHLNKDSIITSIDTYKTVAHESIPGHMYQVNYMYDHINDNYTKIASSNLSYAEGYATYVESYVLNYLDIDKDLRECYREDTDFINSAVILADIGIQYEGWNETVLEKNMKAMGVSLFSYDSLYHQLSYNPGLFAPYYIGYEELLTLKKKYCKNHQDFMKAFLEVGNMPWFIVERHMKETL